MSMQTLVALRQAHVIILLAETASLKCAVYVYTWGTSAIMAETTFQTKQQRQRAIRFYKVQPR